MKHFCLLPPGLLVLLSKFRKLLSHSLNMLSSHSSYSYFDQILPVVSSSVCVFYGCSCYQSFLTVCRDIFLVGLGDEMFKGQVLHLCSLILLSGKSFHRRNSTATWWTSHPHLTEELKSLTSCCFVCFNFLISSVFRCVSRGGLLVYSNNPACTERGGRHFCPRGQSGPGRSRGPSGGHPRCGRQHLPEDHWAPGSPPQEGTRRGETGALAQFLLWPAPWTSSVFSLLTVVAVVISIQCFSVSALYIKVLFRPWSRWSPCLCRAPAVSVSCARPDRLPPGGPGVGQRAPLRRLLHSVCCYYRGEATCAPEGARWERWIQISHLHFLSSLRELWFLSMHKRQLFNLHAVLTDFPSWGGEHPRVCGRHAPSVQRPPLCSPQNTSCHQVNPLSPPLLRQPRTGTNIPSAYSAVLWVVFFWKDLFSSEAIGKIMAD